ncbi:MAG: chromate efflux transporter [Acidimicrobiales bacterium]
MSTNEQSDGSVGQPKVSLWTIAREWTRLGCIGFGGPPSHIALLRRMCVEERKWIEATEFEDAIASVNLLPGPASTQLAIFCAWRLRRTVGAILGGVCFIFPGLVLILLLSAVFLAHHPPLWILGAAAGAGAAVPAVALSAASGFVPASWKRVGTARGQRTRWLLYGLIGGTAAAIGPYLVLVLLSCGLFEIVIRRKGSASSSSARAVVGAAAAHAIALGGFGALAWVAFKVGALSYGGGFVIVPLMQHDAVTTFHWMTGAQFLNAVALGQVTPGPVVLTIAVVGYAAGGVRGGLLATFVAFTPSFLFILFGAPRFDRIRANLMIQSFLSGAGPAVIGAIAGSAIPLGLAFQQLWQVPVLAGALVWFFVVRRGVVSGLLIAGGVGVVLALTGVHV